MQMAYVHLREERPAKALQELTKAEALDPENPETKNWLGLAFWARQDPARAEVKFKEATALKPDYSEAWNNMGALYIELKRYDDAVTVLTRALSNELYSKHDTALTNLGWALLQLGRKDEARAKLEEAVEANPRSPLAQRNLGIAYQELGDHARALEQFEKTIKIYPDDAETHLRKGISLLKTAKKDEARAAFEQAWRLAPTTNTGKSAKNYLDIMQ